MEGGSGREPGRADRWEELSRILSGVRKLPLPEKTHFYGGVVYLCGTLLPWDVLAGAPALEVGGWSYGVGTDLAHFLVLGGLLLQGFHLAGKGPGLDRGVLGIYRFAYLWVLLVVTMRVLAQFQGGLGLWLTFLGAGVQAWALYRLCKDAGLLPGGGPS